MWCWCRQHYNISFDVKLSFATVATKLKSFEIAILRFWARQIGLNSSYWSKGDFKKLGWPGKRATLGWVHLRNFNRHNVFKIRLISKNPGPPGRALFIYYLRKCGRLDIGDKILLVAIYCIHRHIATKTSKNNNRRARSAHARAIRSPTISCCRTRPSRPVPTTFWLKDTEYLPVSYNI